MYSDYDDYSENEMEDYYLDAIDEEKPPFDINAYSALTASSSPEEIENVLKSTSKIDSYYHMQTIFVGEEFMPNENVTRISQNYSVLVMNEDHVATNPADMYGFKPGKLYLLIHRETGENEGFHVYLGYYLTTEENSTVVLEKCAFYSRINFEDAVEADQTKRVRISINNLPQVYAIKTPPYDSRKNYLHFVEGTQVAKNKADAKKINYLTDPHLRREVAEFLGGVGSVGSVGGRRKSGKKPSKKAGKKTKKTKKQARKTKRNKTSKK